MQTTQSALRALARAHGLTYAIAEQQFGERLNHVQCNMVTVESVQALLPGAEAPPATAETPATTAEIIDTVFADAIDDLRTRISNGCETVRGMMRAASARDDHDEYSRLTRKKNAMQRAGSDLDDGFITWQAENGPQWVWREYTTALRSMYETVVAEGNTDYADGYSTVYDYLRGYGPALMPPPLVDPLVAMKTKAGAR